MNIIAVDDEKIALAALQEAILQAMPNACVQAFRYGEDALQYALGNDCDVAFLDIQMQDTIGLELAKRLRKVRKDINIIFVTGYSEYALDAFRLYASDYILKPVTPEAVQKALQNLRTPPSPRRGQTIRFQCFGAFEVFYAGKPLTFQRAKTKELLAYLVDRTGASVTMGELMTVLWEDGQDTRSRRSNLRNLISDLKSTLARVGASELVLKGRNTVAIDKNAADCDYYDFLRRLPYAVHAYRGEYMTQYSWSEATAASLTQQYLRLQNEGD